MRLFIISFIFFTTNFSLSQKNELRQKIVESEGKYGIAPVMKSSDDAIIEFDSIPIQLGGQFFNYYCVKKNGMWGVVFVSRYSVIEVIPYQYNNIKNIRNDFRFELPFLYKCGSTQNQNRGIEYMYLSTENKVLKLNSYNHKKDSIIVFTPKIGGREVILDKEYEYLFAPAWKYEVLAKIEKENVQKVTEYFRKNAKGKNINYWQTFDDTYTCVTPKERGAKSLVIYDEFEDSLSIVYEFIEEPNVIYNILLPRGAFCAQYQPLYSGGLHHVLKTTQLRNKKYKHEFFEFKGNKVYEVISKNSITFWTSEKQIFYGINGKRICRFNPKKKMFSK